MKKWSKGSTATILGEMIVYGLDEDTTNVIKRAKKPLSYHRMLDLLLGRGLAPVYQKVTERSGIEITVTMIVGRDIVKTPRDGGCPQITDRRECCMHSDGRTGDYYGGYVCVPAKAGRTFSSGSVCEPSVWVEAQSNSSATATCNDFRPGAELNLWDESQLFSDDGWAAVASPSHHKNDNPGNRKWTIRDDGVVRLPDNRQLYVNKKGWAAVAFEDEKGTDNQIPENRQWSVEKVFSFVGCQYALNGNFPGNSGEGTWSQCRDLALNAGSHWFGMAGTACIDGGQYANLNLSRNPQHCNADKDADGNPLGQASHMAVYAQTGKVLTLSSGKFAGYQLYADVKREHEAKRFVGVALQGKEGNDDPLFRTWYTKTVDCEFIEQENGSSRCEFTFE